MGCLYCGKEISAIRQLRAEDFCCDDHLVAHSSRLRKALLSLAEPDPPPSGVAGFIGAWTLVPASREPRRIEQFQHPAYPIYPPRAQHLGLEDCFGNRFQRLVPEPARAAATLAAFGWSSTLTCSLSPEIRVTEIATDLPLQHMAAASSAAPADTVIAAPLGAGSMALAAQAPALRPDTEASMPAAAGAAASGPVVSVPSQSPRAGSAGPLLEPAAGLVPTFSHSVTGAPVRGELAATAAVIPLSNNPAAGNRAAVSAAHAGVLPELQLPGFAVTAPQCEGLPAGATFSVAVNAAEGARAAAVAPVAAAEVEVCLPSGRVELTGAAGIGAIRPALTSPSHPACASHAPALSGPVAVEPGRLTLSIATALSVLPPEEFLDAIEAAGTPPEAGLALIAARPAVPQAPRPAQIRGPESVVAVTMPAFEFAAGIAGIASPQNFLLRAPEVAAGQNSVPGPEPFVPVSSFIRLPEPALRLASPPVPHEADLSPEAAPGSDSLQQAAPARTSPAAELPGFSLQPELLPVPALALSPARPANPVPSVADPITAAAETGLPALAAVLEPGGMQSAFVPLPPAAADMVAPSADLAGGWIDTRDGLPPLQAGSATGLELAPHAPLWPPFRRPADVAPCVSRLDLMPALDISMPQLAGAADLAAEPAPACPIPVELYVQAGRRVAARSSEWSMPRIDIAMPRMTVTAVSFTSDQSLNQVPVVEAAKVRSMPRYSRSEVALWGKGMAAAVAVCAFLWIGTVAIRSNRADVRDIASADPIALNRVPDAPQGNGFRERLHRAVANRAKLEVGTDFRDGKDFWNGNKPNWGKGWQRHREGYATPGALALLRPTMQLTDYRMEFLGQIEDKSLSWAFRAHDTDNYYAMKLNVVAPGPRPVISVARYSVTNGKRGRKVEIPLPVMMHNHRPYHVAMEVRGNRFTTSIEGETVDSFVDDALPVGGVGFFSEGVERSRVYWVKVTNNDDLLGRICAYITGKRGGPAETAFTGGGTFDDERGRRPAQSAGMLPWERARRKKAGSGHTAAVLTA